MKKNIIIAFGLLVALALGGCRKPFVIPDPVEKPGTGPDTEVPDTPEPENPVEPENPPIKGDTYHVSGQEELDALGELKPGDEIVWKNGTYKDVEVRFGGKGEEDGHIVFRAETPGKVVFTGASTLVISGMYVHVSGFCWDELDTSITSDIVTFSKGSGHCLLTDCKIDGTGSVAGTENDPGTKWVSLNGLENEVSGCSFIDKRNMGTLLVVWMEDGIVPKHRIENNYFYRPYTIHDSEGDAVNAQETIRIGDSANSMSDACCVVKDNWFDQCHGERAEIVSNKTCGNLYEGNFFDNSDGTLTLRHGNNCIVRGNFFDAGNAGNSGGVRIIGEDHIVEDNVIQNASGAGYTSGICIVNGEENPELSGYYPVKNAVVRNNVLTNCRYGITVNYGKKSGKGHPVNVLISGNTVVAGSGQRAVYVRNDFPDYPLTEADVRFEDNIVYGRVTSEGLDCPTESKKPDVKDYEAEKEAIRINAGVKW